MPGLGMQIRYGSRAAVRERSANLSQLELSRGEFNLLVASCRALRPRSCTSAAEQRA
jgi:hypothetical protein